MSDSIDLHTFRPDECADVVEEFVSFAHESGLRTVRIIHGKGTGTLRRIVHSVLDKHAAVASYTQDENWGATVVEIRPLDAPEP